MTFGFFLLTMGFLLLESGWRGSTPVDVLRGLSQPGAGGPLAAVGSGALEGVAGPLGTPGAAPAGAGGPIGATSKETKLLKQARGTVNIDGKPVAKWIAGELIWARQHGWKGTVNSGYRSKAEQTRIYNSGVRPAAVPGTSNHEKKVYPGGAVDVTNEAELDQILSHKPGRLLYWTGKKIGDNVHFSSGLNGV